MRKAPWDVRNLREFYKNTRVELRYLNPAPQKKFNLLKLSQTNSALDICHPKVPANQLVPVFDFRGHPMTSEDAAHICVL